MAIKFSFILKDETLRWDQCKWKAQPKEPAVENHFISLTDSGY